MKNRLLFIAIAVGVMLTGRLYANDIKRPVSDTNCKDQATINFAAAAQGIVNFFSNARATYGKQWDAFVAQLKDKPETAFSAFGSAQSKLENEYADLQNALAKATNELLYSVDPNQKVSQESRYEFAKKKVGCYLQTSKEYLGDSNGPVIDLTGPCQDAYDACKSSVNSTYSSALLNCYGTGAAATVATGWWGLIAGVWCIYNAWSAYDKGRTACFDAYKVCLKNS
jgi:hypothetical protein